MNDQLSNDIKKKFMLPMTIEIQDHKEKVFHNDPVSNNNLIQIFPLLPLAPVTFRPTLPCQKHNHHESTLNFYFLKS